MPDIPLPAVRAQYEGYPYPPRDPADERTELKWTHGDHLDLANFYCFGGRQDFSAGFRALVAGCGTGDSVVFLAEQLRETGAEVVALDFSEASLDVARRRCEARALANVRFVRSAIEDIPGLGLGEFDFINCLGVLHHLRDPDAGLRILAGSLKHDGGMNLMVYGTHGRAPIYPLQSLLRHLAGPALEPRERIRRARAVIAQLPEANPFRRDYARSAREIEEYGDAGLYDLLLHAQDRAYTVPELYSLLGQAGLRWAGFSSTRISGQIEYDPATYLHDPAVLEAIASKPLSEQHAIAELAIGNQSLHFCYATKREIPPPGPDDPEAIPFIPAAWAEGNVYRALYEQMEAARKRGERASISLRDGWAQLSFEATRLAVLFMKHMDGERSMRELCERVTQALAPAAGAAQPSADELAEQFRKIFRRFFRLDWMLFRRRGSRIMPSTGTLQQRAFPAKDNKGR